MKFKYEIIEKNKKKITIFKWHFNKKDYSLEFAGTGRRTRSFGWLLEKYPEYFNVHDELITKKYKDSNKAVNEFIKDEGFDGFVLEKKIQASNNEKVNSFKLDLPKICKSWNKNHVMEICLFFTGFLFHILCEISGINHWYCKYKKNDLKLKYH